MKGSTHLLTSSPMLSDGWSADLPLLRFRVRVLVSHWHWHVDPVPALVEVSVAVAVHVTPPDSCQCGVDELVDSEPQLTPSHSALS